MNVILVAVRQVASGNLSNPHVVCFTVKFSKIRSHSEVNSRSWAAVIHS